MLRPVPLISTQSRCTADVAISRAVIPAKSNCRIMALSFNLYASLAVEIRHFSLPILN